MGHRSLILSLFLTLCFNYSHGCQIEGANWPVPVSVTVQDIFRGVILNRATTGIDGISLITNGPVLNSGPYVDVTFAASRVVIATNDAYQYYEEYETSLTIPITITFRCTGGSDLITTFIINVSDTNNNPPRFLPSDNFAFTIAAPVPPGFEITGCLNDLIVRDIDLTTRRIDFAVIDNPNFEIEYDAASSSSAKEFRALLRTTSLIRTIPEPITFTITATDVDSTGDPQLTTMATVTIIGGSDFELPEEPVFSETFYFADYTDDNRLVLAELITLQRGYHKLVLFTIEGEFSNNFEIVAAGNQISINVRTPLAGDVLQREQILLVVRADRQYTSGASATVIVRLPQALPLEFERAYYEGIIESNTLQVPPLVLSQGYEGASVSVVVLNEYSSYFNVAIQGNIVTLSMTDISENVINQNNIIYLQVVASTDSSRATAIVSLEIIKDDNVTPVFNSPIYTGSYNPGTGLALQEIFLIQGYDESVSVFLEGEYSTFFGVTRNGPIVSVSASTIPPEIYGEGQITLSLIATKPRTVGSTAAVIITLPAARELEFESYTYRGSLQGNVIALEPIRLAVGYDDSVAFSITGDYADYFLITNFQGQITISLATPLPNNILSENNVIILTLAASGLNAVTTTTNILLDVIKDDTTTPVFSRNIYYGTYFGTSNIVIDNINLAQGFDDDVTFRIEGEHAQYFEITNTENNIELFLRTSIPDEVIISEKVLLFNLLAEKPLTVGANAAVAIRFPSELTDPVVLRFAQNTYTGSIENNLLTIDDVRLSLGYAVGTNFVLTGEFSSYFRLTDAENVVSLTLFDTQLTDVLENTFIVLEIEARREGAVSVWTSVVIDIIRQEIVPPIFTEAYYRGVYNTDSGLQFNEVISLQSGYDETVIFQLDGDFSSLFTLEQRDSNSLSVVAIAPITDEVLADNSHLLFTVVANKPGAATAQAVILIDIERGNTENSNLGFDRVTYLGSLQNNAVTLGPITVVDGYTADVTIGLYGDLASYFTTTRVGPTVSVVQQTPIPPQLIPGNRIIILEIQASASQSNPAYATLVIEVIVEDDSPSPVQLAFDATYYTGSYNTVDGLALDTPITLSEGFDETVQFTLQGENSQWFSVNTVQNSVTLVVSSAIPGAILTANRQLVFSILAEKPEVSPASATIVISLINGENTENSNLGFDRVTYLGSLQNNAVTLGPITVVDGFTADVTIGLYGDLASYFTTTRVGPTVSVVLQTPIPPQLIPANRIIILEIQASASQSNPAYATLVIEVIVEDDSPSPVQLAFDATYYTGSYNTVDGLALDTPITLSEGFDETVQFTLQGENSQWFSLNTVQNSVTLVVSSAIPGAILTANRQLVFSILAEKPEVSPASATIIISLINGENTEISNLGFDRVTYLGSLQNNAVTLEPITVVDGFTADVTIGLYGDLASYFTTTKVGPTVSVVLQTPIPPQLIPANRIIILEIQASASQSNPAYATLVIEVIVEDDSPSPVQLAFDATYYTGSYNTVDGLALDTPITLSEGFDETVQFTLQGENSQWFSVNTVQNSVTLVVSSAIPGAILTANRQLVFSILAEKPEVSPASATIVISLDDGLQTGDDVSFEKVLYEGIIQRNEIQHELIMIFGYNGTNVDVLGEYSSLFVAHVRDGVVSVQSSGSVTLPLEVNRLALELHAAGARAVLLLTVVPSDAPVLPSVTFSSESYVLSVDIIQTGLIGRVLATADNGEAVSYLLDLDNAHLQTRLSINNAGELYLSAPANSGVYTFQVIATTVITQASGTTTVYLTVEAIAVCGDDDKVVPPLIVLYRDEEEAHNNLVVLDSTHNGCYFSLTNRWPTNQNWLYVDDSGLHATAIDREHESIAFMALSQVQVELTLHCQDDSVTRTKRSERTDWLGPYDYGTNKWILTDSIPFNSRRSLVNLIVNDINDNIPIFVGKEHQPIVVGYPIDELEERILPRSLAELKATDADVGENAALLYWSSESTLAVAPSTGFVHVRSGARLLPDQLLTVSATDRNGEGLTGTIQLLVKLLELNNIAVVTVRDAFLDDEIAVLAQLSDAVGYEVKTLRSVVISDDIDEDVTRNKRETSPVKASLQLYVYGLIQGEPIAVDRLVLDINSNTAIVSVISTLPLEDHLEDGEINVLQRDIGLLVATIVLSILLVILILLIAIWFFLRWRKNRNYNEFTDANSLASRHGSLGELPKPEGLRPRLNVEDLKKSERRLQEMLNPPIEEVTVEPMTSNKEVPVESVLDLESPLPEIHAPIVIQSIDKLKDAEESSDDEFGEVNTRRRKSVVTFNENVEKIIHVEDDTDSNSQSGYEIFKL